MSEARILLVEDEESFADALTVGLKREGFEVNWVTDGVSAIEAFESFGPDLILLDVMLPSLSGLDVCRTIRLKSDVPIIMMTARDSEIDIVVGLEVGADDYVTKPYRLRELVARLRAVLRRVDSNPPDASSSAGILDPIELDDLTVDRDRHEVLLRDRPVAMPLKEYELLVQLVTHAGRVQTRDQLIDAAWGTDYVGDTKTLDVHVRRLRSRLEEDPRRPRRIVTVRGVGYRYETRCE